jgi:hypothetical protein
MHRLRFWLLLIGLIALLQGCGGSGPAGPAIRPPESVMWSEFAIPSGLAADVAYWQELNWRAGAFPIGIAGESLSRRRALMYYSLSRGKFYRESTLVIQTVQGEPGAKQKQIEALCKSLGFALADSTYSPYRQAETYYIWIEEDVYAKNALGWLSDYILATYPDDFICVQPMVSDKPFPSGWSGGIHNEGAGAGI